SGRLYVPFQCPLSDARQRRSELGGGNRSRGPSPQSGGDRRPRPSDSAMTEHQRGNGGGGGNRTHVRRTCRPGYYVRVLRLLVSPPRLGGRLSTTRLPAPMFTHDRRGAIRSLRLVLTSS